MWRIPASESMRLMRWGERTKSAGIGHMGRDVHQSGNRAARSGLSGNTLMLHEASDPPADSNRLRVLLVVGERLGAQQKAAKRTIERIRHKPVLLDEFGRRVSGREPVREAALKGSDLVVLVFSSSLDVEARDLLDQAKHVGTGLLSMHVIELLHGWRWEDYKPKRRGPLRRRSALPAC